VLRAVLVDMDGTLIESAHANAAAYAMALAHWGVSVDAERLAPAIDGRSWRDFLPGLLATRPDVLPSDVAQRKRTIYPDFFHLLRLNQHLVDLLRLLHGGVFTGLVTTASSAAVAGVTERFALCGLFDVVVTGDHVEQAKPHPEAYHLAATRLGVAPGECMVIEDSETGLAAAQAFGGALLRWTPAAAKPACPLPVSQAARA